MSGGAGETMATIEAVKIKYKKELGPKLVKTLDKIQAKVKKEFIKHDLKDGETIGKIQDAGEEAGKGNMTQDQAKIAAATAANQSFTDLIRDVFDRDFGLELSKEAAEIYGSKNATVKYAVCEEAMTGNIKFSEGPKAANSFFVFDPSRRVASFVKIDQSKIAKVASNTEFNVSFKSSGTGGSAWVAMKAITSGKNLDESLLKDNTKLSDVMCEYVEQLVNEEVEKSYQNYLLEEGFFDSVSKFFKKTVPRVFKAVKEKFLAALDKFFNFLKEKALESVDFVYNLLGIKISDAEMTKNPDIADLFLP